MKKWGKLASHSWELALIKELKKAHHFCIGFSVF